GLTRNFNFWHLKNKQFNCIIRDKTVLILDTKLFMPSTLFFNLKILLTSFYQIFSHSILHLSKTIGLEFYFLNDAAGFALRYGFPFDISD
ncbi:hypothetical protein ACJX0J_025469, partial [Zea mays]